MSNFLKIGALSLVWFIAGINTNILYSEHNQTPKIYIQEEVEDTLSEASGIEVNCTFEDGTPFNFYVDSITENRITLQSKDTYVKYMPRGNVVLVSINNRRYFGRCTNGESK